MFTAALSAAPLWQPFLTHPILQKSLAWIAENAATAAEGIYELGEPGWFVNVHGYATRPAEECQWENHLQTIDVQYLIEGAEGILVLPVAHLGDPILFKPESDTQKFAAAAEPSTLVALRSGDFVIFLPGEAHCPKVALGASAPLRKLVVKIPARLLG